MNTWGWVGAWWGGGGRITRYVQLHTDKCIPWDERIACVTVFLLHPLDAVFREFISIFGGWMLFCQELIIKAEESPHITM